MKRAHNLSLTQVNNYLASYIECLNIKTKNNEMKNNIIAILFCTLMLASCADSLDIFPHSAISPGAVSEKDLPALRWGMYNAVQNDPGERSFIFFDMLGGTLCTSTGNPRDLINSTLSPLNGYVASSWNGYFSALYQVNNLISITEDMSSSIALRNTVKGEAHFFRAYIYFCLASRWGAVPIIRKNTMDLVSRDSLSDVWAFVESDLDMAISLLGTSTNYYYVSKDAATALKARVMLSEGKKAEAAQLAENLITSGKYKLDTFEKIFRKLSNNEIIFAFENLSVESGNNLSDLFYTYAHPNKGQYAYRPTQEVMDMYESGDKRKDISVTIVSGSNCINKYPSGQVGKDPIIISRLAELYLISAEAQGRNNGVVRLNELRRFRGLTDVFPSTDDAYIDAILLERKKELLAENFMYHDYVRTGKAIKALGLLPYQLLLPIPGKELQLNPNLTSNPGY